MKKTILAILFFLLPCTTFADLYITKNDISFSNPNPLVRKQFHIIVNTQNASELPLRGVVKIFDETEGVFIGGDQSVSVLAHSDDAIFADFIPEKVGEHKIAIRLVPFEEESDNPDNNKVSVNIYIDQDTDGDGIGDKKDMDDDNDGVPDNQDAFPLNPHEDTDTDGDGIGNNSDTDDDNDGAPDLSDLFPLNTAENADNDGDNIGDNADDDDDNDGLKDDLEIKRGTDQKNPDTDNDGVNDLEDDFPLDPGRQFDTDRDGIPNEKDDDDDNDGIKDTKDAFPLDPTEYIDSDMDGIGDEKDDDDDNDHIFDMIEIEQGTDSRNPDSDGDGVNDGEDVFPRNPSEQKDSDNDGLGDNADENDKNKGPVIVATLSKKKVQKKEKIIFDASSSHDPDGGKLKYTWKLDDEEVVEFKKFQKSFTSSGNKKVTLKVTDDEGESRSKDFSVQVERGKEYLILWALGIIALIIIASLTKKSPDQPIQTKTRKVATKSNSKAKGNDDKEKAKTK